MADVSVRPARPADAGDVARIQRDTLAMAYERVLPPETFTRLGDPAVRAEIEAGLAVQLSTSPLGEHALVAAEGDRVVGLAFARRAGDDALEPGDPEPSATGVLEQILVEPRWGRRGHGSRLLAACVDLWREDGLVRAVSWVPESNAATIGLLSSAGWERDGYVRGLDTGTATVLREVRLHTDLRTP